VIAFLACVALASDSRLGWWARGAATAAGTLTLGLAVLCQSRGSVPAFAVSLVVFLVVASERRRALLHLAAAAAPLVPALPWLLEVFADGEEVVDALGPLQDAAIAILLAGLAGGLATAALLRFAPPSPAPGRPRKLPRSAAVGLAGLGAAVLVAAAIAVGSGAAVDWLDQASERAGAQPDLSGEGSRFGLNVETERYDVWRVALDELAADPIRGSGAGGFAFAYLAERESIETPQDPHSVEMLMLSELGVPGLVLLIILFGALVVGGLRSRNRGPAAAQLTAGALAAGAYWLAHASLDWFWNYPALTAPTLALLGAAVAPAILSPPRPRRRAARWGLAGACVLLAIALAPPFLSARWTDRAYEQWRVDLEAAYADLGRAQDANPLADEPLLAEGVIAGRSGDEERAVDAFRRARDLEPESWAARYFLGRALIDSDPGAAVAELEIARSLNPSSAGTRRLLDEARRALES
jgi:O-antigen ligase